MRLWRLRRYSNTLKYYIDSHSRFLAINYGIHIVELLLNISYIFTNTMFSVSPGKRSCHEWHILQHISGIDARESTPLDVIFT